MRHFLLFTTALFGLYTFAGASDALAAKSKGQAVTGSVTTTTTRVYTYDFPDGTPKITTSTHVVRDCCPSAFGNCDGGGNGNGNGSCFEYNTLVLMADGSTKKISEISACDETACGVVHQTFIRRFDQARAGTRDFYAAYHGGLFYYRGILVTGNHAVRDGAGWMAVAESQTAVPVGMEEIAHIGNVYNLDVEGGIIPIVNPGGELIAFLDDKQPFAMRRLAA